MLATWILAVAQVFVVADAREPVAMVLSVKGATTVESGDAKPKPLLVMSIVRAGDQLKTTDGDAVLVILSDSHWERLKPNSQATAEKKGCSPSSAIELQNHPKLSADSLKGLPALESGQRPGVAVLRGSDTIPEPIFGTILLENRPDFAWPIDDVDVEKTPINDFGVELLAGDLQGKLLWSATTMSPSLSYPAKEAPLRPGEKYAWRVTARLQGGKKQVLVEGQFSMASEKQRASLAEVEKLAASESWPDRLLAAALYDSHASYGEALSLYEKLLYSDDRPRPADATKNVAAAMESCYEQARRAIRSKESTGAGKP